MSDFYHPEWKTGEWHTNCDLDEFEPLYVRNEPSSISGKPYNLDPGFEYMLGPPKDSPYCSLEKMLGMDMGGVYKRPKSVDQNKINKDIADAIFLGDFSGKGWSFEVDLSRIGDKPVATMKAIAGFIENGLTQGMTPFWKLTLTKN